MIDVIRVGQTRNLLRASSSLSEIWPRSAHHHLGQRRQSAARTGLTKVRTRSHVQKFRNSLQTERHPQKKVRHRSPSLRAMQILCVLVGGLLARNKKHILFLRDGKLVLAETGNRHSDAVVVLAGLRDVVRRSVVDALDPAGGLERVDKAVETNARPEQRRKVESGSHSHILH